MFERYTGLARECIFRARLEAGRSGSSFIETEHLLLGVFESDRSLADLLLGSADAIAAIRAQAGVPELSAAENPAKDLQLSHESKRVLAYGAEESERMAFRHIGTEHLVLGLLREQDCRAAQILRDRGLEIGPVRERIVRLTRTDPQISETDPHRIVYEPPTSRSDAAPPDLRAVLSKTPRHTGMFGSLTEKVRRSIFFALYEATQAGSMFIETQHLLLGLLREDRGLAKRLFPDVAKIEEIRTEIGHRQPPLTKISTSVDLPLSEDVREALAFASEEAARLKHNEVGNLHVVAGLLRCETCLAAEFLRARGITLEKVRTDLA